MAERRTYRRHPPNSDARLAEAGRRAGAVSLLLAEEAAQREDIQRFRGSNADALAGQAHLRPDLERWVASLHLGAREGGRSPDDYRSLLLVERSASPWQPQQTWRTGGTLLTQLAALVEALIHDYPWSNREALLFVAFNEPPQVQPLRVLSTSLGTRPAAAGRIHMIIDPTTDPSVVDYEYRRIRELFVSTRYKPVGEKAVALATFDVRDQAAHPSERWALRLERWNQHADALGQPSWRYLAGDDNYPRDVASARKNLLRPTAVQDTNTYSGQEPDHG